MDVPSQNVSLTERISQLATDPAGLEELYQRAQHERQAETFGSAIDAAYHDQPGNLLFGAWHFRLRGLAEQVRAAAAINWPLAVGLSVALGLVYWLLSDPAASPAAHVPYLIPLIAPVTILAIMAYLAFAGERSYARLGILAVVLVALAAYNALVAPHTEGYNLPLPWLHVPVLTVGCLAVYLAGWRSSATERFAFLAKALEAAATAGVFLVVGGIFIGITSGLFAALKLPVPDTIMRLFVLGVGGFIPVIAVLNAYNPARSLSQQEFGHGFGRIIGVLLRVVLALALVVMAIYLVIIPFNFSAPFEERPVLIVYNILLFAVLGLLVGVTPVRLDDLGERWRGWLRAGIVALAVMVLLVSAYALVAIIYRMVAFGVSANKVMTTGWNIINIGILLGAITGQARGGRDSWPRGIQVALGWGLYAYLAWSAVVAFILPWLF